MNAEPNQEEMSKDRVAALNQSLARSIITSDDDKFEIDDIPMTADSKLTDGSSKDVTDPTQDAKKEMEEIKKLQNLFKNAKIFLNREVPREPLVFMIRAFGGQVSWDSTVSPGTTFDQDDNKVTHQICDRPRESMQMQHIGKKL